MAIKIYSVDIDILLKPVSRSKCRIMLDDQKKDLVVDSDTWIKLSHQGNGTTRLSIEHYDKAELDPNTALIIEQIKFNGISSPRFVYRGIYTPNYPKHLLDSNAGLTLQQNYLSWNGIWHLDFTLPIYTWIHKVEDLGWIYD
jgi:hypothetical protein